MGMGIGIMLFMGIIMPGCCCCWCCCVCVGGGGTHIGIMPCC